METRANRKSTEAARPNPTLSDLIKAVENLAATNARAPLETEEQIWLFLTSWWSRTYNRPLKDPLLQTYSIEELLYEFFDRAEREKAAAESTEQQNDKIEQAKEQEALDWAEQEEKRELEELAKQEGGVKLSPPSQEEIAANKKWMAEQLAEQKKLLGEDFGENVDFSMDE